MNTVQTVCTTQSNGGSGMSFFDIERADDTMIVIPTADLRELDFDRIEADAAQVFQILKDERIRNVVVDFSETDHFGSSALGFFLNLWKKVKFRKGSMVFCNVSDHEQDMLRATRLDHFWPIHPSRTDAMQAVHDDPTSILRRPSRLT